MSEAPLGCRVAGSHAALGPWQPVGLQPFTVENIRYTYATVKARLWPWLGPILAQVFNTFYVATIVLGRECRQVNPPPSTLHPPPSTLHPYNYTANQRGRARRGQGLDRLFHLP
jgi:hypothetical protein